MNPSMLSSSAGDERSAGAGRPRPLGRGQVPCDSARCPCHQSAASRLNAIVPGHAVPQGRTPTLCLDSARLRFGEPHAKEVTMLWTIFVILLVLWVLGMVSSYTLGGFIHILLVIALAVILIRVIQGRRPI